MTKTTASLAEVRELGLEALERELGPVGMARFIQQFQPGRGDYARDRKRWLPEGTVAEVATLVQEFVTRKE